MRVPVKQHDPTNVVLQKSKNQKMSYGLRLGTRLYIEDIQNNSLAEKSGNLHTGDMIIMINNRSTDNLSVPEAIQLITKTKDRLQITVQRASGGTVTIPTSVSRPVSRAPSRNQSRAASPDNSSGRGGHVNMPIPERELVPGTQHHYSEPPRSKGPSRAHSSKNINNLGHKTPNHGEMNVGNMNAVDMNAVAAGLNQQFSNNLTINGGGVQSMNEGGREIVFHKGKTVGIRLIGGNDTGLFVASVQEGSPASQQGLQIGDQLLGVNGEDFKGKTREEAVTFLMSLPIGSRVILIAKQSDPAAYEPIMMKSSGDCFYVKANFQFEPPTGNEMDVTRGAVYCVRDTLYKGQFGKWHACELDEQHREINYGIIPSQTRADQLKSIQDRKEAQRREKHGARKIKERILKGNSQPSRSLNPISQTLINLPAYERVVLREASFKRPVVVFGSIADIARNLLTGDHPQQFEAANVCNTTQGAQKAGRRGVVKISTLNSIIECGRHAVVDITPSACEKLNKHRLYPIVIFLKVKDKNGVKDLRNRYSNTNTSRDSEKKQKSSKKMFQRAVKLEKGYKHCFTSVVDVSSDTSNWYRRLQQEIRRLQNALVWVNDEIQPDMDEKIIDDDRISMISAPDSQYSCTTIGSEMARSRLNLNDFTDNDSDSDDTNNTNNTNNSHNTQNTHNTHNTNNSHATQPDHQNLQNTNSGYKPPLPSSMQKPKINHSASNHNDDPPPPPGPAPIPPKKDYGASPAQKALANVIHGKNATENNTSYLQTHINQNLNKTQQVYQNPPPPKQPSPPNPSYPSYNSAGDINQYNSAQNHNPVQNQYSTPPSQPPNHASQNQQHYNSPQTQHPSSQPQHAANHPYSGTNSQTSNDSSNRSKPRSNFKEPGVTQPSFNYSPRQVSFDQKPPVGSPNQPQSKPAVPVKPQKPASQYADYVKNLRTQPIANKYGVGNSMPVKAGGGTSSVDNSSENSNSRSRGSNYSGMNSGIPVNPQQIEEVEDGHEVSF